MTKDAAEGQEKAKESGPEEETQHQKHLPGRYGLAVIAMLMGFVVAYQFTGPLPPEKIT